MESRSPCVVESQLCSLPWNQEPLTSWNGVLPTPSYGLSHRLTPLLVACDHPLFLYLYLLWDRPCEPCEQALSGAWGRERVLCISFRACLLEVVVISFDVKMVDEATKRTVASIPTLKTKAGPRDSDGWVQRLKEEYTSLIKVKVIKAKK